MMRFYLSKDKKPKLVLKANGTDLQDRWVLHNSGYFMKNEIGNSTIAFANSKPVDTKLRKTNLALCEDDFLQRTVLVKTVNYDNSDFDDPDLVRLKRRALREQIDILNDIASNMLPEPLDFFFINNTFDEFTGEAKQLQSKEPVLILDYFPGDVLAEKLNNSRDISFYKTDDSNNFFKSTDTINVGIVMRLIGDILAFEMELYEKGYAYTALSPDHIVLLGDNKPRFIGIGRICRMENDRYDKDHINFGRQLRGFSAPEFNIAENNFGEAESVKAAIAYNLGTLIASIMLSRSDFDEKYIRNGSYNYAIATEDRDAIKKAFHGDMIDTLICWLTEDTIHRRLTNFSDILHELAIISGDATRESNVKDTIHHGYISKYWSDREYGFVQSGGTDYFFHASRISDPSSISSWKDVAFTIERDRKNGNMVVKNFVTPPRTDVVYPRMVTKPEPVFQPVKPKPQPTPAPRPQPQPAPQSPQKKGFFARLFGL